MDFKKAEKWRKDDLIETDYETKDGIFQGLVILKKYYPDADICSAEHDQIWVNVDWKESIKKMSEEDVKRMFALIWMEDNDGWSHFA